MKIYSHLYDIPKDLCSCDSVAIDTETMGLKPWRDRLCLVQLSFDGEDCHLVKFNGVFSKSENLISLLSDKMVEKIFHFARFDVMMLHKTFGVEIKNIYCTKIASKLCRTFTNRHSLQDLCKDLLGIEISKEQTQTDWGSDTLTEAQKEYAATDVLYLHRLRELLDYLLKRENRHGLAKECFDFIGARAKLDLICGEDYNIFSHSS
jgi:ribonuclease D